MDPIDFDPTVPTIGAPDTTGLDVEGQFEAFAEEILGFTIFSDQVLEAIQEQEE